MKKKYNNNSDYFKDWTTAKLKQTFKEFDDIIYKIECYGKSDLRMHSGIAIELAKRGIEINSKVTFN